MITIVSGLPRCGTSLMMDMLRAGGMPLLTDGVRKPDADNPRGYFEFEPVKRIEADASWIGEARGKAVKITSPLVYQLPSRYRYRVIFMQRDLREMLSSQEKMLENGGRPRDGAKRPGLRSMYEEHLAHVQKWLGRQSNIAVLHVDYRDAVAHPKETAAKVNLFLGGNLECGAMARIVDPSLYRQRAGNGVEQDIIREESL